MDFTLGIYRSLLLELQSMGYKYLSFNEYLNSRNRGLDNNIIILRHDVDLLPQNAPLLEYEFGIRGVYYFRIKPESFHSAIIEMIAELGHEVGYHYEDVDLVVKRQKANVKRQVSKVRGDRSQAIGVPPKTRRISRWQVRGETGSDRNGDREYRSVQDQRAEVSNLELGPLVPPTPKSNLFN